MTAETPVGVLTRRIAAAFDLAVGNRDEEDRTANAIAAFNDLNGGCPASNTLDLSTAPTATDTCVIGDDTYEFVASGGTVAADTNIAVLRTGTAQTDLDALIAAINGADPDNAHATILKSDGTAALANGTENIFADEIGSEVLRIRTADGPGGKVTAPASAAAVDIACTSDTATWAHANMDEGHFQVATPFFGITVFQANATNIADGTVRVTFPFTVTSFGITLVRTTSSGLPVEAADYTGTGADTFAIDNGQILITLGGGAAPDLQAGDELFIIATGSAEAN